MADLLGHFLYAVLFAGQVMIAKKSRWGWLLAILAMIGFSVFGFCIGMTSIGFWSAGFVIVNFTGFIQWNRKQSN